VDIIILIWLFGLTLVVAYNQISQRSVNYTMAVDLTALTAQVAATAGAEASALTLIKGLQAQLAAIPASTDPQTQAALDALSKQLSDATAPLAAAVAANPAP
jgi:hypothetical protein